MARDDNTSRRTVLAAAAGGAAVAASGAALAQTPRAKGPRVWLDMDQQELDDAYDQIVYAPNREQVAKRRIFNSERTRAAIGVPERVAYGPSEIERLDIYRTKQADAPVNIFVHGGDAVERHVRLKAGAALQALEIRQVHRRDGAGAQRPAPPRQAPHAAHSRARHLRDAGIPAPDAGFLCRREGGGEAGRAVGGR